MENLWLIGKVSASRLRDLLASSDEFVMPNIEVPWPRIVARYVTLFDELIARG